jgi:hypothetical protein
MGVVLFPAPPRCAGSPAQGMALVLHPHPSRGSAEPELVESLPANHTWVYFAAASGREYVLDLTAALWAPVSAAERGSCAKWVGGWTRE